MQVVTEEKPEMASIPWLPFRPDGTENPEEIKETVVEKPRIILTPEQKETIRLAKEKLEAERKKFGRENNSGRQTTVLQERPKLESVRKFSEHDVIEIISDLRKLKQESEMWFDKFKNPNNFSSYKEISATKKDKKDFIENGGLLLLAGKIKNKIDGLVRFGIYNESLFGEQNYKLDKIIPGIEGIFKKIQYGVQQKGKIDKNLVLIYLDELVTNMSIILPTGERIVQDKLMDPSIVNSSDISMRE